MLDSNNDFVDSFIPSPRALPLVFNEDVDGDFELSSSAKNIYFALIAIDEELRILSKADTEKWFTGDEDWPQILQRWKDDLREVSL